MFKSKLKFILPVLFAVAGIYAKTAVAAGFFLRRRFQYDDAGATVSRFERRAQRGVALADDDHIRCLHAAPRIR